MKCGVITLASSGRTRVSAATDRLLQPCWWSWDRGTGCAGAVPVVRRDPTRCGVSSDQHRLSKPADRWALSLPSFIWGCPWEMASADSVSPCLLVRHLKREPAGQACTCLWVQRLRKTLYVVRLKDGAGVRWCSVSAATSAPDCAEP